MPKPRSFLLHLLLIASCIANAAAADDAPSQGEWQLLHASIGVSAMHMQLLPGDFVLMFDRTDTGPSNSSLTSLSLSLPVTVPSTSTHITRPMRRAEELPVIWLIRLCPDAHMSFLVWPYDFLEQMDENIKSVTF